jgi:hypothetical protein
MSEFLSIVTLMLPFIVALLASRYAQSLWAARLLSWGGAIFLIVIFLIFIFELQCRGSMLKGFVECQPAFFLNLVSAMAAPLILALLSYAVVGPIILIVAGIMEYQKRSRNP